MKVIVLTWGNGEYSYTIGVYTTMEKAKQAEKFYTSNQKFPNDPHYTFYYEKIEIDSNSAVMLNKLEEDGWFEDKEPMVETYKDKITKYLLLGLLIFIIACLITGFATIIKLIFGH